MSSPVRARPSSMRELQEPSSSKLQRPGMPGITLTNTVKEEGERFTAELLLFFSTTPSD